MPGERARSLQPGAQYCPNVARLRDVSRQAPLRMEPKTWRRRPRLTAGVAERGGTSCLRRKKPGLRQPASKFRVRSKLIKMSASMTLLASSHKHIAEVGGTCRWQSGSDALHSIGNARWWHVGTEDEMVQRHCT